ncbi:MAG: TatD family hydrolase [Tissierellia bacterium]|jgi:TatD DNase family protein|nr:TatD family hydrolase [Tissierellia bacterium]
MLIDSHAHLDDRRFNDDRDMLIKNFKNNNIELVINIGADLKTSVASVELADKYDTIYAAVGVHPHSAKEVNTLVMENIRELTKNKKVVAIGEIGLDFHYDNSPRDVQRKWFIEQLKLAKELDLPVIIHTREASQETYDILKNNQDGTVRGVMHSFSGSAEMASLYVDMGFYISIGGPVTFKNARVVREVAEAVPLDKLLIETDCPYLTPEPYRGKRNEPVYMKYTAEKIAQVRGISYDEVVKATNRNAKKLFNIKD